jgi:hypothetical protein
MGTFFSGVHVLDFSRVDNVIFRPLLHLIVNILEIMGVSKWSNDPAALEKKNFSVVLDKVLFGPTRIKFR